MKTIYRFKSLSEFHSYSNLPKPEHPLISLVDYSIVNYPTDSNEIKWIQDFYSIGLKRNVSGKFNYGQQKYDFDEGVLSFVAPQQTLNIQINQNVKVNASGWLLLIHPDFLWNTQLAKSIKNFDFFGYSVNEALFLSEKEENNLVDTLSQLTEIVESETIEGTTIQHQGYELIIGETTKEAFTDIAINTSYHIVNDAQCLKDERIVINEHSIDLKLTNGEFFTLKKEVEDEQFFGYTFLHYNSELNIYVFWENWLEAGHPIMVNGSNGAITTVFGETFATNKNQTLTANVSADIGSGWTPNGLQVFEIVKDTYVQLFEFDPTQVFNPQSLNETWGPVDLKWKNDNTIYLECITHDDKSGYLTLYKVIQFKKLD